MAITEKYGDSDLEFAGSKVQVECKLLGGEEEAAIKNYISKSEPGSAEVAAVVGAVTKLYLDDEPVNLTANKPFPKLRNEEGTSLLEFLLAYVVDNEGWLASKFPLVFRKYVGEFKKHEKDPTKSRKGGRTGS